MPDSAKATARPIAADATRGASPDPQLSRRATRRTESDAVAVFANELGLSAEVSGEAVGC